MFVVSLTFMLISACDFQGAYKKALEDSDTGSYGMNYDRYCAGASEKERKQFKEQYEQSREKAKKIRELGIKEVPKSAKELESMMASREVIDGKVEAGTEEGAYKAKEKNLAGRIEELQAENSKLRSEIEALKSKVKK